MPFQYVVRCHGPGCAEPACYKIAARWSDGATGELKTYSLSCPNCLPALYREAVAKRAACTLAPGESLDQPGIYLRSDGRRDRELERQADLERRLA